MARGEQLPPGGAMPRQVVIGLGNPGGEYAWTRHNLGWRVLDELERRGRFGRDRRDGPSRVSAGSVDGVELLLARPQTFMNLSGRAGAHLARRLSIRPEDFIVVHDDIDLAVGRVAIKRGGGDGGQRGVRSLADAWRSRDFVRVRVGVGRPPAGEEATEYVLRTPEPQEREVLDASVVRAADAVLSIAREGEELAMNVVNRRLG